MINTGWWSTAVGDQHGIVVISLCWIWDSGQHGLVINIGWWSTRDGNQHGMVVIMVGDQYGLVMNGGHHGFMMNMGWWSTLLVIIIVVNMRWRWTQDGGQHNMGWLAINIKWLSALGPGVAIRRVVLPKQGVKICMCNWYCRVESRGLNSNASPFILLCCQVCRSPWSGLSLPFLWCDVLS